jgi:hypothetical protein
LTTESNSTQAEVGAIHQGTSFPEPATQPKAESSKQSQNSAARDPRLVEAERDLHDAEGRVAELSQQLREVNEALIDANQELAQLPLLKHRLAEMYDQNAALKGQLHDLIGSRSWQLTEFLRKINRALKRQS